MTEFKQVSVSSRASFLSAEQNLILDKLRNLTKEQFHEYKRLWNRDSLITFVDERHLNILDFLTRNVGLYEGYLVDLETCIQIHTNRYEKMCDKIRNITRSSICYFYPRGFSITQITLLMWILKWPLTLLCIPENYIHLIRERSIPNPADIPWAQKVTEAIESGSSYELPLVPELRYVFDCTFQFCIRLSAKWLDHITPRSRLNDICYDDTKLNDVDMYDDLVETQKLIQRRYENANWDFFLGGRMLIEVAEPPSALILWSEIERGNISTLMNIVFGVQLTIRALTEARRLGIVVFIARAEILIPHITLISISNISPKNYLYELVQQPKSLYDYPDDCTLFATCTVKFKDVEYYPVLDIRVVMLLFKKRYYDSIINPSLQERFILNPERYATNLLLDGKEVELFKMYPNL